jgi:sugar phosphate isomerase/epimerase
MSVGDGTTTPLILCNVSMMTVPFREFVGAAASAGFDGISLLGRNHRRARTKEGLTDGDMRAMVQDHGLVLTELEAVGDWLSEPPPDMPAWMSAVYTEGEYLEVAEALGASNLVAVHFGAPVGMDQAATAFAGLCDRAAERGLTVSLEFPAWATIADVATAWEVARIADQPNGGILFDVWHHYRGPGSHDAALDTVPGERIYSVQLSDATVVPVGPPVEDVRYRMLPGEGSFDLPNVVRTLDRMGVRAPVGVEVFSASLLEKDPAEAARILGDRLRAVLDASS